MEKTVEVCRRQAKSEAVRSVLAAANFKSPAEVVAKLITEQDTVNKERREIGGRNSMRAMNARVTRVTQKVERIPLMIQTIQSDGLLAN